LESELTQEMFASPNAFDETLSLLSNTCKNVGGLLSNIFSKHCTAIRHLGTEAVSDIKTRA